jgi:lysophospholipase L1-like esterase
LLVNLVIGYITPIMFDFPSSVYPFFYFVLRAFLLLTAITFIPILFSALIKSTKTVKYNSWVATAVVFLVLFYIAELFLTFYPETNGKNDTYSAKIWNYYYWKLNKQGYRDIDFQSMDANGKPAMVFVGDSYTEGHGIKNPEDRVSDLIRKKMPAYNIYNIGKNGFDIRNEIKLITLIPLQPKLIVLQICSNDWDYLLPKRNSDKYQSNVLYAATSKSFLASHSIVMNYLSSRMGNLQENLFSLQISDEIRQQTFKDFDIAAAKQVNSNNIIKILTHCLEHTSLSEDTVQVKLFRMFGQFNPSLQVMTDTLLFKDYLDKLTLLDEFCRQRDITLLAVPYPEFTNFSMAVTGKYVNRYLCAEIEKRGLRCLDIFPKLKTAGLKSYTVNSTDNHVNAEASVFIADTLYKYIRKEDLLD